jgi:hypothetical protein
MAAPARGRLWRRIELIDAALPTASGRKPVKEARDYPDAKERT